MLSGILVDKFGARVCLVMSGVIASIGVIICAIATNPLILLVGLSLSGKYFEEKTKQNKTFVLIKKIIIINLKKNQGKDIGLKFQEKRAQPLLSETYV